VDPVLPLELPPNDAAPLLVDVEDNVLNDGPNFLPDEKHPAQSWPSPLITADDEPTLDAEIPELKLPDDPVEVNLESVESPELPLELENPEEDPTELAPADALPPELTPNDDEPRLAELVEVNLDPDVLPDEKEDPVLALDDPDTPVLDVPDRTTDGPEEKVELDEPIVEDEEPTPEASPPVFNPNDDDPPALATNGVAPWLAELVEVN